MEDFLARVLSDSYSFSKLERVLQLKFADLSEKLGQNEPIPSLSPESPRVLELTQHLSSQDLQLVFKASRVLSFLLNYLQLRTANSREWDHWVDLLTTALMEAINYQQENSLIVNHLTQLLPLCSNHLISRKSRGSLDALFFNVAKWARSGLKVDRPALEIVRYYQQNNQLQTDHVELLLLLLGSNREGDSAGVEKEIIDLLYLTNRRRLPAFIAENRTNFKLIALILQKHQTTATTTTSGSSSDSGGRREGEELNLHDFYQSIFHFLTTITTTTTTTTTSTTTTITTSNNGSVRWSIVLLTNLVRLMTSDLFLIHSDQIALIVNTLFGNENILSSLSHSLLDLLKAIKCLSLEFNQLVDQSTLYRLIQHQLTNANSNSTDSSNTTTSSIATTGSSTTTGSSGPNDPKTTTTTTTTTVSTSTTTSPTTNSSPITARNSANCSSSSEVRELFLLYLYTANNEQLEPLIPKLSSRRDYYQLIISQYIDNFIQEGSVVNRALLLRAYALVARDPLRSRLKHILNYQPPLPTATTISF